MYVGIFAFALVTTIVITLFLRTLDSTPPQENDMAHAATMIPGAFPSLHITSVFDPFTQERTFWHDGILTLSNHENGFYNAAVRLRGRGNSTWWNVEDKRPLRLRFIEPTSLLGSPYPARDWILLADYFDRSLLRNYTALKLSSLLDGLDFTPAMRHVHLYVNGQYMGVYLLTDERDVEPGRMQLEWNADPHESDFFMELDARASQGGVEGETFVSVSGMLYDIRFPGSSGRTPAHMQYVKEYLEAVSDAIRARNFNEITRLIDLDSFIDFYIVQELLKNPDVHSLSVFMYLQGAGSGRRLFMGPVWDFDVAAGNFTGQPLGNNPEYLVAAVINYWYRYLMQTPEFFDAVVNRWNQIIDNEIAQTLDHIQTLAATYSHEFERNFERHPTSSQLIPPQMQELISFEEHVDYLLTWLQTRIAWLDDYFNDRLPNHDPLVQLVDFYRQSPLTIIIDGEIQALNTPAIFLHSRILIALDETYRLFGANAHFDHAAQTLQITQGDLYITYEIGTRYFFANGNMFNLSTPFPFEIDGNIFIPLSMITNGLGYSTTWSSATRTAQLIRIE